MTSDQINRIIVEVLAAIVVVGALAAIIVTIRELPAMAHYLRMRKMAKDHDGASPEQLPTPDSPQYAQGPRLVTATHVTAHGHA